jgi:hypothetical protein
VQQLWHSGGHDAFKIVAPTEKFIAMAGPPINTATNKTYLANPNDQHTGNFPGGKWPNITKGMASAVSCPV